MSQLTRPAMFLALFVASANSCAHEEAAAQLRMDVDIEPLRVSRRSEIDIKVRVTNIGNVPVVFWDDFRWGDGGTLEYIVFERNGRRLGPFMIADSFQRSTIERGPKLLEPGESVSGGLTMSVRDLVARSGRYELKVQYDTPNTREHNEFESENIVWTRQSGPLIGSQSFEVVE